METKRASAAERAERIAAKARAKSRTTIIVVPDPPPRRAAVDHWQERADLR